MTGVELKVPKASYNFNHLVIYINWNVFIYNEHEHEDEHEDEDETSEGLYNKTEFSDLMYGSSTPDALIWFGRRIRRGF